MEHITLMDGAAGTCLWARSGSTDPVWTFCETRPELVRDLAREYAEAGAELLLSDTFAVNRCTVRNTPYEVPAIVTKAMSLVREAADSTGAKTGLDIGPLPEILEPFGDLEEDEAAAIFREILDAGIPCHPDYIVFETFMDLHMLELAVQEADKAGIPILASMSFEASGRTMFGNAPEDMIETLAPYGNVAAVGLNCSLGPKQAVEVLRDFRAHTDRPLYFKPNAGLPAGGNAAPCDSAAYVRDFLPALDLGAGYVGGCCGTDPDTIRALREALDARA